MRDYKSGPISEGIVDTTLYLPQKQRQKLLFGAIMKQWGATFRES